MLYPGPPGSGLRDRAQAPHPAPQSGSHPDAPLDERDSFYCVSDLGTIVNDNVTFGEANRQKALNGKSSKTQVSDDCMESWMVDGVLDGAWRCRDDMHNA